MDTSATTTRQRTIAVGVDGSAGAARAVRWATLEALATGAGLRLVSAWDVPNVAFPAMAGAYVQPEEIAEGARHIAERAEHDARRVLGGRPMSIEAVAVQGGPVTGLLDACRDADLLVIGSRGRGGFASLVLGSVAQTCAHHSDIPVVVVGREYAEPGTGPVVVGMDESDGARRALDWSVTEAARLGTSLQVVHGWETVLSTPDGPPVFTPQDDPTVATDLRLWYQDLAEKAVARAGATVPVEAVIAGPAPSEALVEASADAALLVVGSRGRGGFLGLLLGSVSQQVLHHSACPVVVIPHGRRG